MKKSLKKLIKQFKNEPVKSVLVTILIIWVLKRMYNYIDQNND